jgi:hypothetical protein
MITSSAAVTELDSAWQWGKPCWGVLGFNVVGLCGTTRLCHHCEDRACRARTINNHITRYILHTVRPPDAFCSSFTTHIYCLIVRLHPVDHACDLNTCRMSDAAAWATSRLDAHTSCIKGSR